MVKNTKEVFDEQKVKFMLYVKDKQSKKIQLTNREKIKLRLMINIEEHYIKKTIRGDDKLKLDEYITHLQALLIFEDIMDKIINHINNTPKIYYAINLSSYFEQNESYVFNNINYVKVGRELVDLIKKELKSLRYNYIEPYDKSMNNIIIFSYYKIEKSAIVFTGKDILSGKEYLYNFF